MGERLLLELVDDFEPPKHFHTTDAFMRLPEVSCNLLGMNPVLTGERHVLISERHMLIGKRPISITTCLGACRRLRAPQTLPHHRRVHAPPRGLLGLVGSETCVDRAETYIDRRETYIYRREAYIDRKEARIDIREASIDGRETYLI